MSLCPSCHQPEHAALGVDPRTLRRLLETAAVRGELRGLADFTWQVELLIGDLAFALRSAA